MSEGKCFRQNIRRQYLQGEMSYNQRATVLFGWEDRSWWTALATAVAEFLINVIRGRSA